MYFERPNDHRGGLKWLKLLIRTELRPLKVQSGQTLHAEFKNATRFTLQTLVLELLLTKDRNYLFPE